MILIMMMMMTVTLHCKLHILTQVKLHVQLQYLRGFIILTQKGFL